MANTNTGYKPSQRLLLLFVSRLLVASADQGGAVAPDLGGTFYDDWAQSQSALPFAKLGSSKGFSGMCVDFNMCDDCHRIRVAMRCAQNIILHKI